MVTLMSSSHYPVKSIEGHWHFGNGILVPKGEESPDTLRWAMTQIGAVRRADLGFDSDADRAAFDASFGPSSS